MTPILAGIRVLDLSRLLPGPYATRMLAELGAEIIKVEDPIKGDYARDLPPSAPGRSHGAAFEELNAGKRSVALDLKDPASRPAFEALVDSADILVDSFRPGTLARLGYDPSDLRRRHPRLIYCALSGFGLEGPAAGRAGHDLTYLARAGALRCETGAPPPLFPFQGADIAGALAAFAGILAALLSRSQTGVGSVVDCALSEAAAALGILSVGRARGGELEAAGEGLLDGRIPAYGIYETKDGRHLAVGALEPKFWLRFVTALGCPEFGTRGWETGSEGAAVRSAVAARLAARTASEWMEIFDRVDASVELVQSVAELRSDPQFSARGAWADEGYLRSPVRLTGEAMSPAPSLNSAPGLGEHTAAELRALGVEDSVIAAVLRQSGGGEESG